MIGVDTRSIGVAVAEVVEQSRAANAAAKC
jgi:hypothetical protein